MKKNSLVLKEALDIPYILNDLFINDKNDYKSIAKLIKSKKIHYIVTIARGTSDCAALFSSYLFGKYCKLPTYSLPPSLITIEKTKFRKHNKFYLNNLNRRHINRSMSSAV